MTRKKTKKTKLANYIELLPDFKNRQTIACHDRFNFQSETAIFKSNVCSVTKAYILLIRGMVVDLIMVKPYIL